MDSKLVYLELWYLTGVICSTLQAHESLARKTPITNGDQDRFFQQPKKYISMHKVLWS